MQIYRGDIGEGGGAGSGEREGRRKRILSRNYSPSPYVSSPYSLFSFSRWGRGSRGGGRRDGGGEEKKKKLVRAGANNFLLSSRRARLTKADHAFLLGCRGPGFPPGRFTLRHKI